MKRKQMELSQINEVTEKIIDLLKGLPVQKALELLRVTEQKMLFLATVSRPADELLEKQIDIEDVIANQGNRKKAVA